MMKKESMQPPTAQSKWNINGLLSACLTSCVLISSILIFCGFILFLITGLDNSQLLFVRLDQIPAAIVLNLGIIALISTPVIQVIVALVRFSLDKDMTFAGISLILIILLGICYIMTAN
jgi:uncharacterized membrane protein